MRTARTTWFSRSERRGASLVSSPVFMSVRLQSINKNYSYVAGASALIASSVFALIHTGVAEAAQPFLLPSSLISTTYDNSQGAIASLTVGSPIGTTAAAPKAVAANDYVNVWNNDAADGNFGVTTPIVLSAIEPYSGGFKYPPIRSSRASPPSPSSASPSPVTRPDPTSHSMGMRIPAPARWMFPTPTRSPDRT